MGYLVLLLEPAANDCFPNCREKWDEMSVIAEIDGSQTASIFEIVEEIVEEMRIFLYTIIIYPL